MTVRRTWGMLGLAATLLTSGAARAQGLAAPAQAPARGASVAAAPPAAGTPTAAPATPTPAPASTSVPSAAPAEAPAPGATTAQPGDPAAAPPADQGNYTIRMKSLERNVNELKEQVFRTKARLSQLKETVLGGVIGASRGVIRFRNEMGNSFRLVQAVYALDGVQIYSKSDDSGQLGEMKEFDIYNGAIQPGSHTLTAQLRYRGNGFGVFSYLKGYTWNVRSSQTFVAGEGKATIVTVVGYEKGGMTTSMEDKPAIEFRVNVMAPEGTGTASK
jgi:hypothetical protein